MSFRSSFRHFSNFRGAQGAEPNIFSVFFSEKLIIKITTPKWCHNVGALKELILSLCIFLIYFLPLYTRGLTIWGRSRS